MRKKELADYIRHYIRRVIRFNIPVEDSPEPRAMYSPKRMLFLPISEETLGQFLGEEFVQSARKELLFSIAIGLAYHESAHLLSGEDHKTKPAILNNLICDSNDFNFTPKTWPGSIPFTLSLVNTTYQQGRDLTDIPLDTKEQRLSALLALAVEFMRKRRVKCKGKDVRSLPDEHLLGEVFEKIKPIVKEARKIEIKDRPGLIRKLFKVLKDYWVEQSEEKKDGKVSSSGEAGENDPEQLTPEMVDKITKACSIGNRKLGKRDAGELQKQAEKNNVLGRIRDTIKRIQKDIEKEEKERTHSEIEKPYDLKEQKETSLILPEINDSIVAETRNIIRPILFNRSIRRMAPSIVGTRFSAAHFHEIKTNPKEARVRKEVKRIARAIDETSIILCFDRSGSMGGEKEEVTIQIAATLYKALSSIPRVKVQILGFNDIPQLIKGTKQVSLNTILRRIPIGLSAEGGTNFLLALKESLRLAWESLAQKKLVIILTDGDLRGRMSIEDLLQYANINSIKVVCIGVEGSDEYELREYFGYDNAMYVERIQELPRRLKEVAISNI